MGIYTAWLQHPHTWNPLQLHFPSKSIPTAPPLLSALSSLAWNTVAWWKAQALGQTDLDLNSSSTTCSRVPLDGLFILPKTQFLHEQKDLLRIQLVRRRKGMLFSAWHYYYLASWLVSLLSICLLGCTYQFSASFLRVVASSLSFYQKCLMAYHCLEGKDQHSEAFEALQGSIFLKGLLLPSTNLSYLSDWSYSLLLGTWVARPSLCSLSVLEASPFSFLPVCLGDSILGIHWTQYFLSIKHIIKCQKDKMSLLPWMGFLSSL